MDKRLSTAILFCVLTVHLAGCSEELIGNQFENAPPTVWLSAAPPEGTVTNYTVRLWWGGWDPDGEISHYEYVVTDNEGGIFDPADTVSTKDDYKWKRVFANDSLFRFTADQVADSAALRDNKHEAEEFRRSHTFFVRAVDERGMRSAKPVYRSFTARTLSPTVDVTVPKATGVQPAQVPPVTTFKWLAKDYVSTVLEVQNPESVRTIIVNTKLFSGDLNSTIDYIRKNPRAPEWSKWEYYPAPGDTGKFWTSFPLNIPESYVFAVQVKDEAGAVNPVFDLARNMRYILVGSRLTGPILNVDNPYVGSIVTSSPNTPPTIVDIPAGIPMQFKWRANADSYGGVVAGYRYGWDIQDLNDPTQWEVSYTPFVGTEARSPERTFFFGTHSFHVEVVDNSGFPSRVSVTVNVVQFNMTRNLLFIDDWDERSGGWGPSSGGVPSDAEHDAFWESMLGDVNGFNAPIDMVHIGPGQSEVPIQRIADYKALIWNAQGSHTSGSQSFLRSVIRFVDPTRPTGGGKQTPNLVALFMAAGGHVLLTGDRVLTMAISRESFAPRAPIFPIIFRYELAGDQDGSYTTQGNDVGKVGVGENSHAYRDCCVNVLDIAVNDNPNAVRRHGRNPCPVERLRTYNSATEGLRAAQPIDTTFARLELRPEVTGGTVYPTKGLNTDIYNPLYFATEADCNGVAELVPARGCFEPIWGLECNLTTSRVYGASIAFWTTVHANRVPDAGGVAARSAVWGFHPVYFKPDQVKQAIDRIVFEEWQLPQLETVAAP